MDDSGKDEFCRTSEAPTIRRGSTCHLEEEDVDLSSDLDRQQKHFFAQRTNHRHGAHPHQQHFRQP